MGSIYFTVCYMLKTCNFMKNELLHKYLSWVLTKDAEQLQCSTALHLYLQQSYEHKEEKVLYVGPSVTIKEETFIGSRFYSFYSSLRKYICLQDFPKYVIHKSLRLWSFSKLVTHKIFNVCKMLKIFRNVLGNCSSYVKISESQVL